MPSSKAGSTEHRLELHVNGEEVEPCRASPRCYVWSEYVASWVQRVGSNQQKRVRRLMCPKHAKGFAEQYGISLPEEVAK